MPLAQASAMTRSSAVAEPASTMIASSLASIIDWICWICVLALPWASVIVRLSTRPCFFSRFAMSSIVPVVSFIHVGIE